MPGSRSLTVSFSDVASALADGDDAVFEFAPDGTIAHWSRSAEYAYGYSSREMTGAVPVSLVPHELLDAEQHSLACVFADGRAQRVETQRVAKDGGRRTVTLNLLPLRDHNGAVSRVAAIEHELARENARADSAPTIDAPNQWHHTVNTADVTSGGFRRVGRRPLCGTETVLVVDDEPELLHLVCSVLRGHGYTALPATSADEALHIMEERCAPVDLVLSDMMMPRIDGRALFAKIRTWYPGSRFMFMSGSEPAIVDLDMFDNTPTPFLAKPFAPHKLLSEVRHVLDRC